MTNNQLNINKRVYNNLLVFLKERGWILKREKNKFDVFSPPAHLGFNKDAEFYIPKKIDLLKYQDDVIDFIDKNLSKLYQKDTDELITIILENKEIFKYHIQLPEEFNISVKPPIPLFSDLLNETKSILKECANFVILNQPRFFEDTLESKRYLNYVNFLKNEKGSLITILELPKNEIIKRGNIFEATIIGKDINEKFFRSLSFLNEKILNENNFSPEDDFLKSNKEYININVTEKIKSLYSKINFDIEFIYEKIDKESKTEVKNLNEEKLGGLTNYINYIKEKLNDIDIFEGYGKIIELKSKDINSDKNIITVLTKVQNIDTKLVIHLPASLYQNAIEAHKRNQLVKLKAKIERIKSGYKVLELLDFTV